MFPLFRGALATLICALAATAPAGAAVIADFAADFSATANPSGAWSYGSIDSGNVFSPSSLVTSYGMGGEVKAWSPGVGINSFWPTVGLNTGAAPVSFGAGNVVHLAPGQGLLHPGPANDHAVARLTIAADTTAVLAATFSGIDEVGSTTDVHVLLNGVSLFDGLVAGFATSASYTAVLSLSAGDILDFTVGWGANGNFVDDSTGFVATLATADVAEPASAALLAMAATGLAGIRRRRFWA